MSQVVPSAQFSFRQRRLRWHLYSLEPGTNVKLRIICSPETGSLGFDTACSSTIASLHAFGPPGRGLSGIKLLSGSDVSDLKHSRYQLLKLQLESTDKSSLFDRHHRSIQI